jgi:class 3 adenylate cyclase
MLGAPMSETRKFVAILVADVVGCGRLAGADEERTLTTLSLVVQVAALDQVRLRERHMQPDRKR